MRNGTNIGLRWVIGLSLFALIAVSGCGSDEELNSPTAKRLRGVASFYSSFAFSKGGKGPASEQEFKKYLRAQEPQALHLNDVDPKTIDTELFVSERDREPFVVLYGLSITEIGGGDKAPLVAHEKTGKNGKRLAVLANNTVKLVDESGLEALKKSAKP
jgi:hypothetical protein